MSPETLQGLAGLPIVDLVAAAVLVAATLRGVWIGLLREAFSLAALAGAVFAVRRWAEPVARDVETRFQLDPLIATAIGGAVMAVVAIVAIAGLGRVVRRLLGLAGLGLADRLGGAALGAAEGGIAVAVLMIAATTVLGRTDPMLQGTRTLAAFEAVERWSLGPPGEEAAPEGGRSSARVTPAGGSQAAR